jgi:succinate-semialdehyde dehydrogenase / glutarate-semialdehyde dehydrogenase
MAVRKVVPISSSIRSINPATAEVMQTFEPLADNEIDARVKRAAETAAMYRDTSFDQRRRMMLRVADILESEKQNFARTITLEMGKLLRAGVEEVEKCALGCRYYADHAERFLADEPAQTSATTSFVRYQPLGVVLAVMPWNFPFWQVFRFAAPALMAGNVALLKHASNVPQCALTIERIFLSAGFAEGIFQTLLIGSDKVPRILADPRVAAASLTGSVGAGSSVAATAGKHVKKTVLELGGSDPFIVMPSADLERTLDTAIKARTVNNGQSCVAAKRFILHREIADDFERRFVERMKSLKVGDPMDPGTQMGPLSTSEGRDLLEEQVNKSVQAGARVLCGGRRLDESEAGRGWFYAPTVLTDIPTDSPAYQEELFGPVASIFRARDIEDAIGIANDTRFGLGSSLWSNDKDERAMFVDRIEAGMAFINGMVASDPRIPFGGIKQSGYGRELSIHGIREFVNIKSVCVYELEHTPKLTE